MVALIVYAGVRTKMYCCNTVMKGSEVLDVYWLHECQVCGRIVVTHNENFPIFARYFSFVQDQFKKLPNEIFLHIDQEEWIRKLEASGHVHKTTGKFWTDNHLSELTYALEEAILELWKLDFIGNSLQKEKIVGIFRRAFEKHLPIRFSYGRREYESDIKNYENRLLFENLEEEN